MNTSMRPEEHQNNQNMAVDREKLIQERLSNIFRVNGVPIPNSSGKPFTHGSNISPLHRSSSNNHMIVKQPPSQHLSPNMQEKSRNRSKHEPSRRQSNSEIRALTAELLMTAPHISGWEEDEQVSEVVKLYHDHKKQSKVKKRRLSHDSTPSESPKKKIPKLNSKTKVKEESKTSLKLKVKEESKTKIVKELKPLPRLTPKVKEDDSKDNIKYSPVKEESKRKPKDSPRKVTKPTKPKPERLKSPQPSSQKTNKPTLLSPKLPLAKPISPVSVSPQPVRRDGSYYTRESRKFQKAGTDLKHATTKNAKSSQEKYEGYLSAGLKYLESIHAEECALDNYIEENNFGRVKDIRSILIRMCRDVGNYFKTCIDCIKPDFQSLFYLSQAVCYCKAFNLSHSQSNVKSPHSITVGTVITLEHKDYLASLHNLLLGNMAWEQAYKIGKIPPMDPHSIDCIHNLINILKDVLPSELR